MPTEEQEMEQERRECLAETFNELARLTHKINNPLTSLMGRAQMLQMSETTDERTRRSADVIFESSERIARYVAELARVVKAARDKSLT